MNSLKSLIAIKMNKTVVLNYLNKATASESVINNRQFYLAINLVKKKKNVCIKYAYFLSICVCALSVFVCHLTPMRYKAKKTIY